MTKLEQLIQTHCPDGVNYKTMGELGCFYGGITGKSKDDFKDGNARFITYKNVYSNPALKMDLDDFVKIDSDENQRTLEYGDVIFTGSSECVEECGLSSVVTKQPTENLYLNSFCFIFRFNDVNCMLPDFTKHLFRSHDLRRQIIKTASGVTRYNVSKEKMKKISIPVPPLPVQEEIVRILDKFTELEAELAQELAQELARRKQQYAFYRDRLLSFESPVVTKFIGEICSVQRGKRLTKQDLTNAGEYPVYHGGLEPLGFYHERNRGANTVMIINVGASAGTVGYCTSEFWSSDGCFCLSQNKDVVSRYLFHFLKTQEHLLMSRVRKAGIPTLDASVIENIKVPVPSLEVQQRLVNVLDNFDAICSDLSIGLPAEISARQKQYEYYRDLLFEYAANGLNYSRAQQSTAEHSRAQQSTAEHSRAETNSICIRSEDVRLIQCVFGVAQLCFGDIFDFQNGFAFKSSLFRSVGNPILRITNIQDNRIDENGLVFFDKEDYKENLSSFLVNPGDIVIAMSGATTGKVGVNSTTKQYYLNQRVGKFIPKDEIVLNRYLYHLLSNKSEQIYKMSDNGSQPNLSSDKLKQLIVHIPSIDEQRRIVNILDRLDGLCNDISDGLPAEIEMRQKQYAYYRDKLLNFGEVNY